MRLSRQIVRRRVETAARGRSGWALGQADRIDPVQSGSFRNGFKTTIESRQPRLILGVAGGWCDDFVSLGDRRK